MNKILITILTVLTIYTNARVIYSGAEGNWSDANTWVDGLGIPLGDTPTCGDTIMINAGDIVTIATQLDYTACADELFIYIEGELHFVNGKKIKLPCDSRVQITGSGSVTSGGGGGHSNLIDICGTTVWKTSDGDITDPLIWPVGSPLLPIELFSFKAELINNNVFITWTTLTETNNDYFIIEKSNDGINYKFVGIVDGEGYSNKEIKYSFIDNNINTGVSYYRLKQVDFDGKYEYFDPVAVNNKVVSDIINCYPNPVNSGNELNIKLNEISEDLKFSVVDIQGRIINSNYILENNTIALNTNYFEKGIYFVVIEQNNQLVRERFIVK